MKIYKCKYCGYESIRKVVRKHIRKNHFWKGSKLNSQCIKKEFK